MRLTRIAILATRGAKGAIKKIADAVDVSEPTVYRWLETNNDNLTKAAVLNVIKEETGLRDEDILEASEVSTN